MYTNAEDWLERFKAAGCTLTLDVGGMRPKGGTPVSPGCRAVWAELQGAENKRRWDEVLAEVQARIGPFTGWKDY